MIPLAQQRRRASHRPSFRPAVGSFRATTLRLVTAGEVNRYRAARSHHNGKFKLPNHCRSQNLQCETFALLLIPSAKPLLIPWCQHIHQGGRATRREQP